MGINHLDPTIPRYRIKITGLPMGTKVFDLEDKLGKRARGWYKMNRNQTTMTQTGGAIGYLTAQTSDVFAQKTIRLWGKKEPFPGFSLQYQLEFDNYDRNNQQNVGTGRNYPVFSPGSGANTQQSTQEYTPSEKGETDENDFTPDDGTIIGKYLRIIKII